MVNGKSKREKQRASAHEFNRLKGLEEEQRASNHRFNRLERVDRHDAF